ncbi:RnfH family protein [Psychrobacter ciconiae]|uniref:RnfH family protein n=1 Tax=Psychrobacter ciconiae TaxID=1553449 RepID=UPI001D12F232|nr:RnfH family protein [Psychrobacter ciconiae]
MGELITVQLAFAETCERQHYLTLQIKEGSTILQALEMSGWLDKFADLENWCQAHAATLTPTAKHWRVGVFSQKQPLTYLLRPNDRIEVYRGLTLDPMEKRKNKSKNKKR